MAVRVDCGTSDPFYGASRRLDARLPFRHQAVFGPGHHEPGYWRTVAPAQLQTIASALGLRGTGAP
jgi:S-formylglutathione hydrolase FrmB